MMLPKNPFATEQRIVTGIDWGAAGIKLVTLRLGEQGQLEVVRATHHPFERPAAASETPEGRAQLVAALRQAREAHGEPLGTVVIALPRERATVRYVELPSTVPEEVKEMLLFDVERHVPFPLDQLQLDFTIVEQTEEGSSVVMLVATPLEEVEALVQLYTEAGIEVNVVDVDVLAACAAYLHDRQDTTSVRAILDIGRDKTDLGVLVGGKVRFSRSFAVAGRRLEECAREKPAEAASGGAHPAWLSELTADLNRQFRAYECEPKGQEVKEVVVCGGLSGLPELERHLAAQLGRRVRAVPPELDGIAGVDGTLAPGMTVALGLALRSVERPEINLLPAPVMERRQAAHRRRVLRNVGIYLGVVVALIGGIAAEKFQAKFAHRARLVEALAEIEPQIADIRRKKAELADIQANVDAEHSFYKVVKDLYERTPDGVMYLTIEFEKKKQVALQGRAGKDDEVYNLINVLKESPHFQDVIPGNLRWQQMYKQPVREFDITCILKSNEEYRRPRAGRSGARR